MKTWINGGLGCSGQLSDSVIFEVFSSLSDSKCVSWKNGDVREQGGQPRCHQEQHREPRKVSVSRNSFRIHFLLSHQWNFTVAEVSVLAGLRQDFLQQRTAVLTDPAAGLLSPVEIQYSLDAERHSLDGRMVLSLLCYIINI